MSRIRSKNTSPECKVRSFLHKNGLRFRLHRKDLPGKPDVVLPKYKTVVFVHGCFWHAHHGCKDFVIPKTQTEWWINKFEANRMNDEKHKRMLVKNGWSVITIWECQLKKSEKYLLKLVNKIKSSGN